MKISSEANTNQKSNFQNYQQELLNSFNETKNQLDYEFICFICYGILKSSSSMKCKNCECAICNECLLNSLNNPICFCKESKIENFELISVSKLDKLDATSYVVESKDQKESKYEGISYQNFILKNYNPINTSLTYSFKIKNEAEEVHYYQDNLENLTLKMFLHQKSCKFNFNCNFNLNHLFKTRTVRLMHFVSQKGFNLELNNKILCAKDYLFLKNIVFKKISLQDCIWDNNASFILAKIINKNQKKLKSFILSENIINSIKLDFKSYIIIFKALSLCFNLNFLMIDFLFRDYPEIIETKSFYTFLSSLKSLQHVIFSSLRFSDKLETKVFDKLISLKSIKFQLCDFLDDSFITFIANICMVPNLLELNIGNENMIVGCIDNDKKKALLDILILKGKCLSEQFELTEDIFDSDLFNCINIFIHYFINFINFINSKNGPIKKLNLRIPLDIEKDTVFQFISYLNKSSINTLGLIITNTFSYFNIPIFFDFLQNSKYLINLSLKIVNEEINWKSIIQAISSNYTIRELHLSENNLREVSEEVILLISKNKTILKLYLDKCYLSINKEFAESILNNQKLLLINLSGNLFETNIIDLILKSSIKIEF